MTDFVLGVFRKVKEREKRKIVQLSLEKDETLIEIRRAVTIKEKKKDNE